MNIRPISFPDLPASPEDGPWPPSVHEAHMILCRGYAQASRILRQEDHDATRLRILSEEIQEDMVSLLVAMDVEIGDSEWADACARALAATVVEIEQAADVVDTS
jgi:hypothetical protein